MISARFACVLAIFAVASAEVYFKESFNDDKWSDRWVASGWKDSAEIGKFEHTAGKYYADAEDKAIQTSQDARFYGISAKMPAAFDNKGKDLVIQYTVKHEQALDCGGAYIKLLPSGLDQAKFGGESDYAIMFGPDVCGTGTRKTHVIITYDKKEKKPVNYQHKGEISCETDNFSHLYTLIIKSDDTYEVQIDGTKKESGKLSEKFDFLHEKKIKDPAQSKPTDWVDEKKIPDPEDKKPEGYDDIPKQIPDPEASKPDDWDDEDDGEWEAPMIDNPEYKGEWKPKMIDNPAYKGEWEHPMIDNPDYFDDNELHVRGALEYVGFELWQVKSGTMFDDIIVTDSVDEAKKFADETFYKKKDGEKKMYDKQEEEKKAKEEAEKKAKEEAEKKDKDDEDEDDEDEDDEDDKKKEL